MIVERLENSKENLIKYLNNLQMGYAQDTGEIVLRVGDQFKCYRPDADLHLASQLCFTNRELGKKGIPYIVHDQETDKYVVEWRE